MKTAFNGVNMVGFLSIFFHGLAVVLAGLNSADSVAAFNLEEQVQLLQNKYDLLEAKVIHLEARIQQHEILAEKLSQLEPSPVEKELTIHPVLKSAAKSTIPRTCADFKANDPTVSSGMHWIDPDGYGIGDDPIYVYCDMIKGSTMITHDSESLIDVGHCADPGCYTRVINYNATGRQMNTLVKLSSECHQSIKYDCVYAPFVSNNVTFGWWNDKNGNSKYFWSGGNTDVHTCQCGINGNCIDPYVKCNCDAAAPIRLSDDGIITHKEILPITQLNFGRTQLDTSSGVHTLGRFECSGKIALEGMPTSCEDLWLIGHQLNGLYSIMGVDMVESVYCDFTKFPNDPGFQTWIGFIDIQSLPTYFYVQKNMNFNETGVPLPYEVNRLNIGGAMNLQTGKFTAPRTGTYFFSFSAVAALPGSSSFQFIRLFFFKNGLVIGATKADARASDPTSEAFHTMHLTLALQVGDQVWVQIDEVTRDTVLYDEFGYYTNFLGWLLREDISQTLVL